MKTLKNIVLGGAVAIAGVSTIAYAAGNGKSDYKMVHKHWHFNGITGRYDKAAAQRGYKFTAKFARRVISLNM